MVNVYLGDLGNVTTTGTCVVNNQNDKIEITIERYEQLVETEANLKAIKKVLEADTFSYGYSECTARTVDILLEIKRDEK